jgi:ribonuclease P protein component
MERLKRRTDFRAAAAGARAPAGAFVLQARQRAAEGPVRVGFTVSRQVGTAVERNRVRRRLREMVRLAPARNPDTALCAGHDYVLIGRRAALTVAFGDMVRQFDAALRRIHTAVRTRQEAGHETRQQNAPATGGGRDAPLHRAGSPAKGRDDRRDGRRVAPEPRRDRRKDTD